MKITWSIDKISKKEFYYEILFSLSLSHTHTHTHTQSGGYRLCQIQNPHFLRETNSFSISFINCSQIYDKTMESTFSEFWFGLVSLFNGISTFVGYLMPNPFS